MKKIILKHMCEGGRIDTRVTARTYTHVVVGRFDNASKLLKIGRETPERVRRAEQGAREHWAYCLEVQAAGVGGYVDYMRDQGGYGSGRKMQVFQGWYDSHVATLKKHGTLEAYVLARRDAEQKNIASEIESVSERNESFFVVSWHQSHALAAKGQSLSHLVDVHVEAVNNGVRS